MELEITPSPDEDEREAIAAVLAEESAKPPAYASGWRRAAVAEALEPDDAT